MSSKEEIEKAIKSMQKFVRCRQDMTAVTAREMNLVLKELERLQEENRLQKMQLNSAFDNGFIHKDKMRKKLKELLEGK